jgi:elongation factor 1-alpha
LEHSLILTILGIKQVIVVINKMDAREIGYSEESFKNTVDKVKKLLANNGIKVSESNFIPVSGLKGENIKKLSENMSWYKGKTLYELLDGLDFTKDTIEKLKEKPLRIHIQDRYGISGIGKVFTGLVSTGVIKKGQEVVVMPHGLEATVGTIEMHHNRLDEAIPRENIGFTLKVKEEKKEDMIVRGNMECAKPLSGERLVPVKRFEARIVYLEYRISFLRVILPSYILVPRMKAVCLKRF